MKLCYDLSNYLGSYRLCSFRLVLEGKTGNKIPESSRLEFSVTNFALSDAEDSTSYSRFTFLGNTIGNSPTLHGTKFLGIDEQWTIFPTITSLSELYIRFRRFILLIQTKKVISELWQQHKPLKTMKLSEDWPDTYHERYTHQFQPKLIHKIH